MQLWWNGEGESQVESEIKCMIRDAEVKQDFMYYKSHVFREVY